MLYLYGTGSRTRHIASEVPEEGVQYPIYSYCDNSIGFGTYEWALAAIEANQHLAPYEKTKRVRNLERAETCKSCLRKAGLDGTVEA